MAEELDELRVDALHDVAIRAHEVGAVGEKELRIGAQEVRELGERPLVADRLHHAVHLPVDSLHLRESRLVDLLGRAIRGRLDAHVVRVPRGAIGERAHPHRLASAGDVRLREKRVESLVRGLHLLRVRLHCRSGEPLLLRLRNARRKAREHHEHGALHRIVGEQPLHLLGHIAQRDLRSGHLRGKPLLQQRDVLIDHGAEPVDARDDVLVVLDRRVRIQLHRLREELRTTARVDREILSGKASAGDRVFRAAAKEIVVELIVRRERCAIDRRDHCERILQLLLSQRDRVERRIGPPAVLPLVSRIRGRLGILGVAIVPVEREQLVQAHAIRLLPFLGDERLIARGPVGAIDALRERRTRGERDERERDRDRG